MIAIVRYEELENDINVGFRRHNFIVYGSIGKELVGGLSRKQILQKVYEIIKPSMDYETERYNQDLSNSIVDNSEIEEVEEFIPEKSKVVDIEFKVPINGYTFGETGAIIKIPLQATLKSQYNEIMVDTVDFTTSHGTIEDNVLTLEPVEEFTELIVTATYNHISKSETVNLYPYVEPLEDKVTRLEEENFNIMLATTEMYEEQYNENLNLMLAITELYEMNMEV